MQLVSANGISIACESDGAGPALVLVGGMDMGTEMWRAKYVPFFVQSGYRTLALNLRGVAPSDATPPPYSVEQLVEDCEAALGTLGVREYFLVGASLGAYVAQEWALEHPNGKKGLALIATAARRSAWFKLLAAGELELYDRGMAFPPDYVVASDLLQMFSLDELLDDRRIQQVAAILKKKHYSAPGRRGLFCAAAAYDNRLRALRGIVAPTIVFGFEQDVLTPARFGLEVAQAIPGSRYIEIANAGHYGILGESASIRAEVAAFFSRYR